MDKDSYRTDFSREQKYGVISSPNLYSIGKESFLIEIYRNENDSEILKALNNRLENLNNFINEADIIPFLKLVEVVSGDKKDLIWTLILSKVHRNDVETEKKLLLESIKKSSDPFLQAYSVNYLRGNSLAFRENYSDILDTNEEIKLVKNFCETNQDLIKNTIELLNSVKRADNDAYTELITLLTEFLNNDNQNYTEKLQIFLDKYLDLWKFPEGNQLSQLYSGFSKIEAYLMTSIKDYHDHVVHSFRVFLIGLQLLVVKWETSLQRGFNQNELLCWLLTSFFHDVGYGLEKLDKTFKIIQDHYKILGTVREATFTFSESSRIFSERVMEIMHSLLTPRERYYQEYEFLRLSPILESWDQKRHGLMSAIIFLRELDILIMENYDFYKRNSQAWNHIFLRAALAMGVHTYRPDLINGLDIDRFTSKEKYNVNYPLFPAFLLILIDSIEYIDRPKFGDFLGPEDEILERDISMKLSVNAAFSLQRYNHIHFKIEYRTTVNLVKIAKRIRLALHGFKSQEWGITISLEYGNTEKLSFHLLKKEEEKFNEYLKRNRQEIDDYELYKTFTSVIALEGGLKEDQLKQWIPNKISYQIEDYLKQKNE